VVPQGSAILNTAYFASLTQAINGAGSCAELQALATEAIASLNANKAAVNAQIADLAPMLALLTAPSADPTAIVTYLTSLITNFLTPMLKPSITYATQLTQLSTQIATMTAAITSKAGSFPSCSITLP
jgi:hypothetical protein